ncbi:MAG: phage tail protein I [Selenomonadaceae bacterium]
MKTNSIDMIELIPKFLQKDDSAAAIAKCVNAVYNALDIELRQTAKIVGNELIAAAVLDELAVSMHIEWYDYAAPVETKRQIIAQADYIHSKMGTIWAIRRVIDTYYSDIVFHEWYQYGGEPYHFSFSTENLLYQKGTDKYNEVIDRINQIKNCRSICDGIFSWPQWGYFKQVKTWGDVKAEMMQWNKSFSVG